MKTLFLSILFFMAQGLMAADAIFVVYHTKGIIKNNKGQVIKKGDQLLLNDQLTVPAAASAILICKNYETVKLNTKGNYYIKILQQQCQRAKPSATSSYFSYVWAELTHPHGSPDKDPASFMRNSGAVSRGCRGVEMTLPADTILYYAGRLQLPFRTLFVQPVIGLFAEAEEGESLGEFAAPAKTINIDTFKKMVSGPGIYYWQIMEQNGEACERNYLKILTAKEYTTAIARLLKRLPVLPLAADVSFMKAFVLEENHFLAEARYYYQMAANLAPKNLSYQKAQSRFL